MCPSNDAGFHASRQRPKRPAVDTGTELDYKIFRLMGISLLPDST